MKTLIAIFLALGVTTHVYAQGAKAAPDAAQTGNAEGILYQSRTPT